MHKKILVIILSLFLIGMGTAFANGPPENGGGGDKVTIKDNNINTGHGNTGIQGNKNHHNTIVGGDLVKGNVYNGPKKVVQNNNNTNTNTNIQGQKQGQAQMQGQQQSNSNEINIEGDTITYEADKREHIQGPGVTEANAQVVDTKASMIRAKGDLLSRVSFLTMDMAKRASKNASDMKVEPALLWENDFQTTVINKGFAGEFGGFIYIFADGPDCYLAAMDAEAAEVAMENGFTHIRRLDDVEVSKVLDGTSWNIGISGGASIMSAGEDLAIAPNGGLGYGKAKTHSQYRPDAVYEVSFAKDLLKGVKKSSKAKFNYTVADNR